MSLGLVDGMKTLLGGRAEAVGDVEVGDIRPCVRVGETGGIIV